ncbi:MAG: hypothetical protein F4Z38_07590 [Chloroflexi bacterium]|nr:hypothetical protein [Chloroflexota bacterium]
MSQDASSRHEEWLRSLDARVRAEVETEIAYYKPGGQWEFEEPVDDEAPSDGTGPSVDLGSEEMDADAAAAAD